MTHWLLLALMCAAAPAREPAHIVVTHAWSPPTAAGRPVGVAYLSITNNGTVADTLTAVSSPIAESIQIHETTLSDGMARMRPLESVAIAPGRTVRIEPGGIHLMLMGLKRELVAGATAPLTLTFAQAGTITVQMRIEAQEADSGHSAH